MQTSANQRPRRTALREDVILGAFRKFRQQLRKALIPSSVLRDLTALRYTQGGILAELNRTKPAFPLRDCEFGVFSQWGEDGIIQKLISSIPIANCTFIEFGVEDFTESNCRFLMMHDNWRGYVIDGASKWISALTSSSWFWKWELRARHAIGKKSEYYD
ncbi:MAG: hypothetical protein ABJE47_11930, partial [bacterium]